MTIERRNVGPRLSDLVIYAPPPSGPLLYLAGQVGEDYAAMNAVWDAWVPSGDPPARATVEARLAHPSYRVEIQVVAAAAG